MLDRTDDSSVAADTWLAQFEEALAKPDDILLKTIPTATGAMCWR